jgi:ATP-dependent Clp protease ATP-binding subunit ClpB
MQKVQRVKVDHQAMGKQAQRLTKGLSRLVVGQEGAIREIATAYQTHETEMGDPSLPACSMLFLGPTGSGKTRIVEALAECMVMDPSAIIKIACGEYQYGHNISKLIGAPPGYLGHNETRALLAQDRLNQYHTETVKISFLLFDEIEKASDELWDLMLNILDKATLTLGNNDKVDFSRTMIFCTGNAGAKELEANLQPDFGFSVPSTTDDPNFQNKSERIVLKAARRIFTTEFLNRFDKVIPFNALSKDELAKVFDLEFAYVTSRRAALKAKLNLSPTARKFLVEKGTANPRWGARGIKRVVERYIAASIANLIASDQYSGEFDIVFSEATQNLEFYTIRSVQTMSRTA